MAVVLAYLPDPVAGARLRRALGGGACHTLVEADAWPALRQQALRSPPDLVVVDPFVGAGGLEHCAAVKAAHPCAQLLPYGRLDGRPAHELFRLFELGVQVLVVRDRDDDPAGFRGAVETVLARALADRVLGAVGDVFPPSLHPLLRHLLLHAGSALHPDDVARSQHCHSKTLRARLRAAGLPSLNRLIVWTRLLAAAHRVSVYRRPLEQVALGLDFPSAAALRTQLQRYAAMSAHELRTADGVDRLLARFRGAAEQAGRRASAVHGSHSVRASGEAVRQSVRAAA